MAAFKNWSKYLQDNSWIEVEKQIKKKDLCNC